MLSHPLPLLVLFAPLVAAAVLGFSGRRISPLAYRIGTVSHVASFVASVFVLRDAALPGAEPVRILLVPSSWPFLTLGLSIDRLAAVMMVLITGIGAVIHMYSVRFMQQERRAAQYHGLLSLAIGILLFMVSGATVVMLFLFWQLLSWVLSLLAYNYVHVPTARGAFRTFIMLRAGDVFFLAGIVLAWHLYGSVSFGPIFARAASDQTVYSLFGPDSVFSIRGNTLVTLLIFVGAMSKSAQFPLHMWLPDSLYAPTPVHALLHAGIINAGGFLLNRLAPLYALSPSTLHLAFFVGLMTALLGASMMLAQNDIKKTLGYSTIGQMGYMIMECGLGAFALAVFHLIAHGLFKATIFLNCGHVIHAARQDPREPKKGGNGWKTDFDLLPWLTGFVATLILPLVILLAIHGVLEIPPANSRGAIIFLFFSWITSSQAILTLYRLRAFGSWKAASAMLVAFVLVIATYLFAVERFTLFLYPEPGVAAGFFHAAALPAPLFTLLIVVASLLLVAYWISIFVRSHGKPEWYSEGLHKRLSSLGVRMYLLFLNRLYLDALALRAGRTLRRLAERLDKSRLFLHALALLSLMIAFKSLAHGSQAPITTLIFMGLVALLLPLFPVHGLYVSALIRQPGSWGFLPGVLSILLPGVGILTAAYMLPGLPHEMAGGIRTLALAGAVYGTLKALVSVRVTPLLAYASLALYSILWWHMAGAGTITPAMAVFAGAASWVTGGLLIAWGRVRLRYGDIPISRIGGLAKPMPRLFLLTALLVMAGAGLPPFGLFSGYLGMLLAPSGESHAVRAIGAIVLLSAWFLASWVLYRLMQKLFFGPHPTDLPYQDLTSGEVATLVVVLAVLLVMGLLPFGCTGTGGALGGPCAAIGAPWAP